MALPTPPIFSPAFSVVFFTDEPTSLRPFLVFSTVVLANSSTVCGGPAGSSTGAPGAGSAAVPAVGDAEGNGSVTAAGVGGVNEQLPSPVR